MTAAWTLSGGSAQIANAIWNQFDADTLADRAVTVSGDPGKLPQGHRAAPRHRRRPAPVPHGHRDHSA